MNDAAHPAPPAVTSPAHSFTIEELRADALGFRHQCESGAIAHLSTSDAAVVAAALVALDGWAGEVRLAPPELGVEPEAGVVRLDARPAEGAESLPAVPSRHETRWTVYTSGTTGTPKPISHTTESLTRTVVGNATSMVWGLLYDPNRMAGLQVLLQGLHSGSPVVAPAPDAGLGERVRTLIDADVDALSATPSLWRQILQLPDAASWGLRQITLGGEIADQRILDALSNRFPNARIIHVFASTETGAAFSVKDRRAGFPVTYLTDPPRGIRLDIRDDILHIHSPKVSVAEHDGFASTGDIVEIVDDRVLFRGRSSGVVNVGGSNVWPETVEALLRQHPAVLEAVVSSKPNPMMGNVLVATVSLSDELDAADASKALRSWVRSQAPKSHVPASVTVVDELRVSASGKVLR